MAILVQLYVEADLGIASIRSTVGHYCGSVVKV